MAKDGQEPNVTDDYVNLYLQSHKNSLSLDYNLSYLDFHVIDSLLPSYTLLDIGCGTAGYYHILKNATSIVGVDHAERMIDVAKRINNNLGTKTQFICSGIDDYFTANNARFDVINLGVCGHYVPHHKRYFEFASNRLNQKGILAVSFMSPIGFKSHARMLIKRPRVPFHMTRKSFFKTMGGYLREFSLLTSFNRVDQYKNGDLHNYVSLFFQKQN